PNQRTLGSSDHAREDHPATLANGNRLQARLLLPRHPRLGFPNVENYIRSFDTPDCRIDNFDRPSDVLVVNGIPLGLAHLLKDDLFGQLSGNAPQDSLSRLRNMQFST